MPAPSKLNIDMRDLIETVIRLSTAPQLPDSPAAKFMTAYRDMTSEHPLDHRSRLYGHASLEVTPSINDKNNRVHISDIMTLDAGKGHGSTALKALCDLADEFGVDLELGAKSYGRAHLSTEDLVAWYGRYGFVPQYPEMKIEPEYLDDDGLDMIRRAKGGKLKLSGDMKTIDSDTVS